MAISSGNLDSLLNQTFPVDADYFGVNFLSGTETGANPNAVLSSVTVRLNGLPGSGATAGVGETMRVKTVDDTNSVVGLVLTFSNQTFSFAQSETVVGYDPMRNTILLSNVQNSNAMANLIALGGASSSTFANSLSVLSTTTLPQGATLTIPALNPPGPPAIIGTVTGQPATDGSQLMPFGTATITDFNAGQTERVTVTLSVAANGTLSNLGGGSYNVGTGTYSVSGLASEVTAALRGLVFTPAQRLVGPGQTITTTFTVKDTNTSTQSFTDSTTTVVTTGTLLGNLTIDQQLELIYLAYFNRSADGGNAFWGGQNAQAQASGQTSATALTNIANSFEPQPETIALYPFLGIPNLDFNTPAAQAGLNSFIGSVCGNLLGHGSDPAGMAYWVGQITNGAVGLGAAALAIANGATGSDATDVLNKITVAVDFTTRTAAAGLGTAPPLPDSFIAAAGDVLSGVDGKSVNDNSVTVGTIATTAYISSTKTSHQEASAIDDVAGTMTSQAATSDPNVITVTGTNQLIDPGIGHATIAFLVGSGADTLVPHADAMYQVSGFDPGTDTLDLGSLFADASGHGGDHPLSAWLTIVDRGPDAQLWFDPSGHGNGSAVAVFLGLGTTVTGLDNLHILLPS